MHGSTVTINGKRWKLKYVSMRGSDGECDPPEVSYKEIRIAKRLQKFPHTLTETLIHESLHAGAFNLSEETVEQIASDIARLLDKERCINHARVPDEV